LGGQNTQAITRNHPKNGCGVEKFNNFSISSSTQQTLYASGNSAGRRSKRNKPLGFGALPIYFCVSARLVCYCSFQNPNLKFWTNNATEQAIGRMKMRARTVRGYKSWQACKLA